MKRRKSRLLAGLLSMSMVFSVVSVPIEAFAATDTGGHWAEASINNWINRGYINGYPDGTFRPNNAISRAEFVTIANKAFGFTSSQGISFNDVKPGYWAYSEIQKGVAAGYVQGDTKGTFRPGSAVSRQEAAVMLARLRGYDNDEAGAYNYEDRWAMANWAVGAIGAVSRNGVMSGYPDGTFRPQRDLTRAEAVASLQKIADSSNTFGNTGTITNSNYNTNNHSTEPVYVTPSSSSSSSSNSSSSSRSSSSRTDSDTNVISTRSSGGRTVLDGTRLENRTLTTDLEIPRSVGSKNVTLKNIRMKGTLYIEGGGTITLENCDIGTVVMDKKDAVLKNNGSSEVEEVRFEEEGRIDGKGYNTVLIDDDRVDEVIIDADIDTLTLDADVDVRLYANTNIDTFEITKNADRARIRVGEDAQITEMQVYDKVRISGKGKIDTMTVYVSGVHSGIEPRRLIQQDGARKPSFGYQDDDDDDDDYENLTIDDDDEDFDGDDERYDRVRIAAEDVSIRDLTAYDDLIVTSAARNSTIRIDDVTVKGDVYIEGGGDSSVIFDDCDIEGNIYSRKNTSGRYDEAVAIKLRNTSVKGDVYVTGDTILDSNKKLNKVILNKELSQTFRMDAEAANVTINYKNDVQLRGSKTIDSIDVAAGLNNVNITMNGGKVSTLTTRSPIKIDGTGTIDKLLTNQTNDIGNGITVGSTGEVGDDPAATSYTITSSVSGDNGTISPVGQQTVANGGTQSYTITPNSGYHVAGIVVDSTEVSLEGKLYSGFTYTFNNVKANHEIIVSFATGSGTDGNGSASNGTNSGDDPNQPDNPSEDGYTISATVNGSGGGVDNDVVKVKEGEDGTVTFTADSGYRVSEILVDDVSLKRIAESTETYKKVSYTFVNVTKNHTISAKFVAGQGTNEIGIKSTDEDSAVIKPSGYKYKVETMLTDHESGEELVKNGEGRYYCIAGDIVHLQKSTVETDDPNKEFLTTKWVIVNNTTDMNLNIVNPDSNFATLNTTTNNGHAVMLRVQVYDTSKESNISAPVYQSDVIELHVDVPVEKLMLSNSEKLYCQTNQYVLSPQNFTYIPAQATAANDRQNIKWEVVESDIKEIEGQLKNGGLTVEIEDVPTANGATVPTLMVTQKYTESNSIVEKIAANPTGTVVIEATIPNGHGKMKDYTKKFTIEFIGTKVISVADITIANDQKIKTMTGKQELDLNDIASQIEIRPENATYKQVQWKIISDTRTDSDKDATPTATVQENSNGFKTKIVSTGYPGEIVLRPYIVNGIDQGKDFDLSKLGEGETTTQEIKVTVNVKPPTLTMNEPDISKGTDAGDKIILSAKVTNANETPFTEIKTVGGWEKLVGEEWKPITTVTPVKGSPSSDGTYSVEYTIEEADINEDNSYVEKIAQFRAVAEFDKNIDGTPEENKRVSNVQEVSCKAQPVEFPEKTDTEQSILVRNDVRTIAGYDKVTLPSALKNGTKITWDISTTDKSIAEIDKTTGQVLITKGKPNQTFTLTADVENKGKTTFTINNTFVNITVNNSTNSSRIAVRNTLGENITTARPGQEVYLKEVQVLPANASYHGYESATPPKLSWVMGPTQDGSQATTIPTDVPDTEGNYKYEIEDTASGTLYFQAVWQRGRADGSDVQTVRSNPIAIQIVKENPPIVVTGIDFSAEKDLGTVKGDSPNYTTQIEVSGSEQATISLGALKYKMKDDETSRDKLKFSVAKGDATIAAEGTKLLLPIKAQDEVIINIEIDDENYVNSDGKPYKATLTIKVTVPTVTPTPPQGGTTGGGNSGTADSKAAPARAARRAAPIATVEPEQSTNNTVNNNVPNNTENSTNNVTNSNTISNGNVTADNKVNNTISNEVTTGIADANGFVAVNDISFSDVIGLQPTAQPNVYNVTSNKTQRTLINLGDFVNEVSGAHAGIRVLPTNATNQTVTWSVGRGTPVVPSTTKNMTYITGVGRLNKETGALNIDENVTATLVLVATVKNGKGGEIDFTKQITINISPTATQTVVPSVPNTPSITPNTPNVTQPEHQMPENTTQASTQQTVSVGMTQVGTSSVQSTGATQSKTDVYKENTDTIRSTISNEDVSIEFSGECRKGISIALRAVSKSTQQRYTDVDWEIAEDGGTNAKIDNGRFRATSTGTATVRAIVYTSSGERMVCTRDIRVSN